MNKIISEKYYDVAVSDLDGTLLRADGQISAKTKTAIDDFCKRGGVFALCSGRMTASVLNVCIKIGMTSGYVISFNGAEITNVESCEKIYQNHVSNGDCVKLLKYAEENEYYVQTYPCDVLTVNEINENTKQYASVCGVDAVKSAKPLSQLFVEKGYTSGKVLFYKKDGQKDKMMREISALVGKNCNVLNSNSMHIDIMSKGVSKGDTVLKFLEFLGKDRNKLICFGDELNDESMLSVAACAAVTSNGNKILIDKADLVIASCEQGGVGECIKKYCI